MRTGSKLLRHRLIDEARQRIEAEGGSVVPVHHWATWIMDGWAAVYSAAGGTTTLRASLRTRRWSIPDDKWVWRKLSCAEVPIGSHHDRDELQHSICNSLISA